MTKAGALTVAVVMSGIATSCFLWPEDDTAAPEIPHELPPSCETDGVCESGCLGRDQDCSDCRFGTRGCSCADTGSCDPGLECHTDGALPLSTICLPAEAPCPVGTEACACYSDLTCRGALPCEAGAKCGAVDGAGGAPGEVDDLVGDWFPCADEKCLSTVPGAQGWRFTSDWQCWPLYAAPGGTAYCNGRGSICSHDGSSFGYLNLFPITQAGDVMVASTAQVDTTYLRVAEQSVGECRYAGDVCDQPAECESGLCESNICCG